MGYLKDPKSTKAAFDDEGYFRTGDLARCNHDSVYTITGRIKASETSQKHFLA